MTIVLMRSLLWSTLIMILFWYSQAHPRNVNSRIRERAADRRLGSEMGGGALDARAHVCESLARLEFSEREGALKGGERGASGKAEHLHLRRRLVFHSPQAVEPLKRHRGRLVQMIRAELLEHLFACLIERLLLLRRWRRLRWWQRLQRLWLPPLLLLLLLPCRWLVHPALQRLWCLLLLLLPPLLLLLLLLLLLMMMMMMIMMIMKFLLILQILLLLRLIPILLP